MGRAQRSAELQPALFAADPHAVVARAEEEFGAKVVRRTALLSGGNDSTVLCHWLWHHGYIDEALHIDTGTGLMATRIFVMKFCRQFGIPLKIYRPAPGTFERMVFNIIGGFPGPAMHRIAYQRLKERPLANYVADCKAGRSRRSKVMLFTGVRRAESTRRMGSSKAIDEQGGRLWVAPLVDWTKIDLLAWRQRHQVPESEVAALLHLSGECFCGAFAKPDERSDLAWAYPEQLRWIESLEAKARLLGIERDRWGGEPGERPPAAAMASPLCTDCQLRLDLDVDEPCPERPTVAVEEFGTRRPLRMTARIHTPGRTPGPHAWLLHEVPYLTIDRHAVSVGTTRIGRFRPDGRVELAAPARPAAVPIQQLLERHAGAAQTAIDLEAPCGCSRRAQRSCGHPRGLAVWAITWPEQEHHLLTPGPIRLANHDMRDVFDRLRIVNRILVLQDDPIARLLAPGDSIHRAFGIAGVWQLEEVGRFTEILIARAADVALVERAWASRGLVAGRLVSAGLRDIHQPLIVAAHPVGAPSPDPVPTELLDHRFAEPVTRTLATVA